MRPGLTLSVVFLALCAQSLNSFASELMRGFPPPVEARVTRDNFMQPPYNRWAFQHLRELQPSREVYRGDAASAPLKVAALDLEGLSFDVGGKQPLTLDAWLEASATDAFIVLHRGSIVYERYFNGMQAHSQHQMFSATKSFIGALVLTLIEEGKIEPGRQIQSYLPELANSAFGDATVQQVLDMTTSIEFSEDYADPRSDIGRYGLVFNIGSPPAAYSGPQSIYDYLPSLKKSALPHGKAFHYVTPNTDVLGWLASRVSGQSLAALTEKRLWRKLGVERDGYFWLDDSGREMAGGGLNITARDAARFGQMILQGGKYNGQQVLSKAVTARILQPGNPDTFAVYHRDPWYRDVGFAYHDQWWTFNNSHKAVSAIGVHGQFIYLDPAAEMVVVKQSSHPEAEGESNEVHGPIIWHAIARKLMGRKKASD